MSGGSFDYLCFAAGDAAELAERRSQLAAMAAALEEVGTPKARLAARNTRDVDRLLAGAERISQGLADTWHGIEWWHSRDWSREQATEAIEEYQPEPPAATGEENRE